MKAAQTSAALLSSTMDDALNITCFVGEDDGELVYYIPIGTCKFDGDLYQYYITGRLDITNTSTTFTYTELELYPSVIDFEWHKTSKTLEYKRCASIHVIDVIKLVCSDESFVDVYNEWHFPEEPIAQEDLDMEYYASEGLRTWIITKLQAYARWCMKNDKTKECKLHMKEIDKNSVALPCVKDEVSHILSIM